MIYRVWLTVFWCLFSALGDNKAIINEDNEESKKKNRVTEMTARNNNGIVESSNEPRRGMVLPFEPLSLTFNHVNYYVDMPAVSLSLSISLYLNNASS